MIARRSLLGTSLAAIAVGTGARSAGAQDRYPSKPIRLVIPFPPGGGADAVARPLGPLMTETLGQPVVLDNRGGANGNLGAEIVAKAPADGYTLLLANSSLTISGGLYAKLPFNPLADFSPISLVGVTPSLLATNPTRLIACLRSRTSRRDPNRAELAKRSRFAANVASCSRASTRSAAVESWSSHKAMIRSTVASRTGNSARSSIAPATERAATGSMPSFQGAQSVACFASMALTCIGRWRRPLSGDVVAGRVSE